MKKWENPQIHNLELKETKGVVYNCPICASNSIFRGTVTCYFCDCCGAQFHDRNENVDNGGASEGDFYDDPKKAYEDHIAATGHILPCS